MQLGGFKGNKKINFSDHLMKSRTNVKVIFFESSIINININHNAVKHIRSYIA